MHKCAVPVRIHRTCTSTLYPWESTANAVALYSRKESTAWHKRSLPQTTVVETWHLKCTCALQNKNNTFGLTRPVCQEFLFCSFVLCYFPVALCRRCQQKQLRERTQSEKKNGYMAPGMLEKNKKQYRMQACKRWLITCLCPSFVWDCLIRE